MGATSLLNVGVACAPDGAWACTRAMAHSATTHSVTAARIFRVISSSAETDEGDEQEMVRALTAEVKATLDIRGSREAGCECAAEGRRSPYFLRDVPLRERFRDPPRLREPPFFLGTLPPARRASLRPIAIACLRLVTFFPDRPDLSVPRLRSCMARFTFWPAFLPYFAIIDPLVEVTTTTLD